MKFSENEAQNQEAWIVIIEFIIIVGLFFLASHLEWLEGQN